jgi:hypothetical protein
VGGRLPRVVTVRTYRDPRFGLSQISWRTCRASPDGGHCLGPRLGPRCLASLDPCQASSETAHDALPEQVRTFSSSSSVFKGTPSARRAVRPQPGFMHGHRAHQGRRWASEGFRRRRLGLAGESRRWGGSVARCLSVGTHGAGDCRRAVPPHPPPGAPRRHAPWVTAPA